MTLASPAALETRRRPAASVALQESASAVTAARPAPSAPVTLASAATAVLENKMQSQQQKLVAVAEATNQ